MQEKKKDLAHGALNNDPAMLKKIRGLNRQELAAFFSKYKS